MTSSSSPTIFDAHTSSSNTLSPASSVETTNTTAIKQICPNYKSHFVEALVDSAAILVQTIWPASIDPSSTTIAAADPLKRFIQETLRRSRTSYSTLQLALYYLIKLQPFILAQRASNYQHPNNANTDPTAATTIKLRCGRRGFLASLMIASKYVQDRNYSTAAWSKISGLSLSELSTNELAFLAALDWNAHVKYHTYERLSGVLFECACDNRSLATKLQVWGDRFRNLDSEITVNSWPAPAALKSSPVPPVTNVDSTSSFSKVDVKVNVIAHVDVYTALTRANIQALNTQTVTAVQSNLSNMPIIAVTEPIRTRTLKRMSDDIDAASSNCTKRIRRDESDSRTSPMRISNILNHSMNHHPKHASSFNVITNKLTDKFTEKNSMLATRIQEWNANVAIAVQAMSS